MKKYILLISFFCIDLQAKGLMSGLELIKKKVEKALEKPAVSFKELFEKSKKHDSGSGAITITSDSQAVVTRTVEQKIQDLEAQVSKYYWCGQCDMIEVLKKLCVESNDQARDFLKKQIDQRYPEKKFQTMLFAHDLQEEETQLTDNAKKLQELMEGRTLENKERFERETKAITQLSEKINRNATNLHDLICMIDKLLYV